MKNEMKERELEKLVAYLDGEVSEQEAIEVEQALSTSEQTRAQVDSLERTWELLDRLPIPKASDEFTNKTLSTIKTIQLEAQEAGAQQQSGGLLSNASQDQVRKLAVMGGWIIGLALSIFVGYQLTNQWLPDESDPLIEDFSFIENIDTYSEIQNLEFLEELQKSGLFDETAQQ